MNTIFIASDHAGFELKAKIQSSLRDLEFKDLGPDSKDSVDYPDYAHLLSEELTNAVDKTGEAHFGILICGSGQGMAITANKHPQIRAALCLTEEMAKLAREHNDANVLCLASRLVDESVNLRIIKRFFETPFEGGRHENRVQKI